MREFATKVDDVADTLAAGGFNAYITEMENICLSAGFTLDSETGPDTNLNMLGQTVSTYAAAAWRYADSGIANAYVLSRVASSNLKNIAGYYDGMAISFIVGTTNTGASSVNVATLGSKDIYYRGIALTAGIMIAGESVLAFFDTANDRFNIASPSMSAVATSFDDSSVGYTAANVQVALEKSIQRQYHTGTQALSTITGHTQAAHNALNINAATVGGYTPGNGSGNLAINNGTLNTNLNADKLDSQEGSYYLDRANGSGTQALTTITGHDTAAHDALNINADKLDGQHGSYYRDASNLNAGILPAARFNDTAHGTRAGGTLHAVATGSVNGFFSSTDKTKMDTVPNRFKSAAFTWTANTIETFAHSLSGTPINAYLVAKCISAEHGYGVGDWAFSIGHFDGSVTDGPTNVRANGTNVYFAGGDQAPRVINQVASSAADWAVMTPANWEFHLLVEAI